MDMQLNKELLKHEREKRAWSQSHLAEVAGLSLRTVQRLERTGSSSLDSAKALASAFDTNVEKLYRVNPAAKSGQHRASPALKLSTTMAICSSVLLAVTWWSSVFAEPIMIDLAISSDDKLLANVQLLNEVGKQSEMQIDGLLKVQILPTKVDGKVRLTTHIFEYQNQEYKLKAQPEVISANKETAEIHFDTENGENYQLRFKPHL